MSKYILTFVLLFSTALAFGQEKFVDLRGMWKFSIGDKATYKDVYFDDSRWDEIFVPSPWEEEGFEGYDGFAWYRKEFSGRDIPNDEIFYLDLGYIDDADEVYLNGTLVGFSGSFPPRFKTAYTAHRKYYLPPELINRNGRNVIAIRVFDVTFEGGILQGKPGIYGADSNLPLQLDLRGIWEFQTGREVEPSKWTSVMVPVPWEAQGEYRKYDGFGWYRKEFVLPDILYGEDLVLLLGRIDDFDVTYLNGQRIGETNDGRPYGRSMSFSKLRAYRIPANVLKRGKNEIRVLVEDIGNTGGIYEGPVGITTHEMYFRNFK